MAAIEALERNHGKVFEDCDYAPDFKSCFVCQRATITDSLEDDSLSLPSFLDNHFPPPTEHSGANASHIPPEISTSSTSVHIPPTNIAHRLGPGQPGVAPEAPAPIHQDPIAHSSPCPPSNQPHLQDPTDLSTLTPKSTGETVKISRKRDKIRQFFRWNRGQ